MQHILAHMLQYTYVGERDREREREGTYQCISVDGTNSARWRGELVPTSVVVVVGSRGNNRDVGGGNWNWIRGGGIGRRRKTHGSDSGRNPLQFGFNPTHTHNPLQIELSQLAYILTRTPSTARPARALLLASFVRLSGLKTTHLAQCTIFISFPKFSTLKFF